MMTFLLRRKIAKRKGERRASMERSSVHLNFKPKLLRFEKDDFLDSDFGELTEHNPNLITVSCRA